MTDKEKVIAFYKDLGIEIGKKEIPTFYKKYATNTNYLTLCAGQSEKVGGYSGFEVEYTFDENDNFVNMSIWE